uniref:BLOC-1-related complex subunit 7 n=1 Tax=Acrobeloides nanus TaxID=290746 RepID=A0A914BZI9_9BILA
MSKVVLEGKNRLPGKIQEAVLDLGVALAQVQTSSGSTETLSTLIKNYVALDPTIENTSANLGKLEQIVGQLETHSEAIEHSIEHISDIQDKMQAIERNNYYCKNSTESKEDVEDNIK